MTLTRLTHTLTFTLTPENNRSLQALCGQNNVNIQQIEKKLCVFIQQRNHDFHL